MEKVEAYPISKEYCTGTEVDISNHRKEMRSGKVDFAAASDYSEKFWY